MQINTANSSSLASVYSTAPKPSALESEGGATRQALPNTDAYSVSLSSEGLQAMQSEQEVANADSSHSAGGWNWTTTSAGISHATGPDGREWRRIDLDQVLTSEDKNLLGWPASNDPAAQQAALFIALDRADGYLKGPVTQEYLQGNQNKNIPGLAERSPAITESAVSNMLKHLG